MRVLLVSANVACSPYAVYPLGMGMIAGSLRNAGHEVSETTFDAVNQYAGAFRCWHHPLVRESKLDWR